MPSPLPAPLTDTVTPKMLRFVEHYLDLGGRHQGRAAIMAGYAKAGADAVASRLLRRPDVLALLRHITETRIKADVVLSAETLKELRDDPTVPPAVRRQCANDLLDRAGMLVEKFATVHHVVEHRGSASAESIDLVRDLLAGFVADGCITITNPERLQRTLEITFAPKPDASADVTDADFEELDDDGRAGLEDVL